MCQPQKVQSSSRFELEKEKGLESVFEKRRVLKDNNLDMLPE